MAWSGMAWYGTARYGYGMAWYACMQYDVYSSCPQIYPWKGVSIVHVCTHNSTHSQGALENNKTYAHINTEISKYSKSTKHDLQDALDRHVLRFYGYFKEAAKDIPFILFIYFSRSVNYYSFSLITGLLDKPFFCLLFSVGVLISRFFCYCLFLLCVYICC